MIDTQPAQLTAQLTAQLIAQLAHTPNRGDRHLFLGHPLGSTCDKTTVEPGNGSSPGLWSCGISVWALDGDTWLSPDCIDAVTIDSWDLQPPALISSWSGPTARCQHTITHHADGLTPAWDVHEIRVSGATRWCVVARGMGPAGADIHTLTSDATSVTINGVRLSGDGIQAIECHDQIACLFINNQATLRVAHRDAADVIPEPVNTQAPASVFASDPRIDATWRRCAHHLLAAAEHGLPRISVATYPGLWFRDGILIAHAWDLIGRSDLARHACEAIAPIDFAGGFGAETDAPGEVAWLLAQHAAITRDPEWLISQRPHLERRAHLIHRMRRATTTIRASAVDRMPRALIRPDVDVVCRPAHHGIISSRMDWHAPDVYCNAWSIAGLRAAAAAAKADHDQAAQDYWTAEADDHEHHFCDYLLPTYGNPRDPVCSPWPTAVAVAAIASPMTEWFAKHRFPNQERHKEPLWTYFEVAQIHNAMRCGLREPAWACLDGLLNDRGDVADYGEGKPHGAEHLPWGPQQPVGWLQQTRAHYGNMPHGWTCAEIIACLRSLFVIEDGDQLRIGSGVPAAWLTPGHQWGVRDLPTTLGLISFTVIINANGQPQLHTDSQIPLFLDLPAVPSTDSTSTKSE